MGEEALSNSQVLQSFDTGVISWSDQKPRELVEKFTPDATTVPEGSSFIASVPHH
jgi:hypothetical protein